MVSNKLLIRRLLIFAGLVALTITGCPDRSYQRPVPDYGNMSDSGGDEEAEDETAASLKDE